jgi:DNA polymerase (family 10)
METEKIAHTLKLTAQLMELHNENPFKVKSMNNAAFKLDKTDVSLEGKSVAELESIDGIGKSIANKIIELQQTGTLKELKALVEQTPAGVIEMLGIKGIGPKKVAQLWKELGTESPGELLYACNENRLVVLKGFGAKTQEAVKKAIEFNMASKGLFHYASLEKFALNLVEDVKKKLHSDQVSLTGAIRRKAIVLDKVEILLAAESSFDTQAFDVPPGLQVEWIFCTPETFVQKLFETTASKAHLEELGDWKLKLSARSQDLSTEDQIYAALGLQYIEPELREGRGEVKLAQAGGLPKLIQLEDLKGILHNHSNWSDGIHSLKEMASYCKELGYEYLGMCDHSQSAFYANGLKPDRVAAQHLEIDQLNLQLAPFRIFKGIESDILYDGSLDYPEDVLQSFDFVVASVHSVLKMDEEKATSRLIKAIENPYTTILGHPTGRLLLSREGYPINHRKVIEACAANGVVIELNAHPYRLDIDWTWIGYCLDKGVRISINPDAHEMQGYHDMYFGVCAARKGMLRKEMCFNALNLEQIQNYFSARKPAPGSLNQNKNN